MTNLEIHFDSITNVLIQVSLASMKGTKFCEPFMEEVDYWERGLSMVLEVLESMLNVQRQWMYLGKYSK